MFRKDVGTFVRLYDFMSQIIDYGDPALEKKSIYLRHLDRVIQPEQLHRAHRPVRRRARSRSSRSTRARSTSASACGSDWPESTAAGSGEKQDPKMVAFQQVLDRLNDLFGTEDFTEVAEGLVPRSAAADPARRRVARPAGEGQLRQAVRRDPRLRRRRHRRGRGQPGRAQQDGRLLLHQRTRPDTPDLRHRQVVLPSCLLGARKHIAPGRTGT